MDLKFRWAPNDRVAAMTTVNQAPLFRGWSISAQRQLTELAVAGQTAHRSGYTQSPVGAGPAAATVQKLREMAVRTERVRSPSATEEVAPEKPVDNRTATDEATVYIRNQLRNNEDGQAHIIEDFEQALDSTRKNIQYARETQRLYEETGEVYSVSQAGNFKIEGDFSEHGGRENYIKQLVEQADKEEKYAIPNFVKIIEEMKHNRFERLVEYGVISSGLDINA